MKFKEKLSYFRFFFAFFKNKILLFLTFILTFISITLEISSPYYIKNLIDNAILKDNFDKTVRFCLLIILINIGSSIISYLENFISIKISNDYNYYFKQKFIDKLFSIPYHLIKDKTFGGILTLFEKDIGQITAFNQTIIFGIVTNLFHMLGLFFFLYCLNFKIALLTLLSLTVYFLIIRSTYKCIDKVSRLIRKKSIDINAFIYDRFYNILYIKLLAREQNELQIYNNKYNNYLKSYYKISIFTLMIDNLKSFAGFIGSIIIILYGSYLTIKKEMTIGELLAINSLFISIFAPASFLINLKLNYHKNAVSFERIIGFFKITEENNNGKNINKIEEIVINNLSFGFEKEKLILKNLSFNFKKGEIVLLKGNNGSGKSTLCFLLLGFYSELIDPMQILIDTIDIKDINVRLLRNKIALLPQKVETLSGTIESFITTDGKFDEEFLKIREYEIDDVISKKGKFFEIKRNGENLSGGEKQRLYLSRILANNYDFYIFDEFESSQDHINKNKLKNIVQKLKENNKGVIIVTHNNEFDNIADKILCLN